MSLKKPTLKEIVDVLETLSEQGFIDVGPQERGCDLLPLYNFLVLTGLATKESPKPGVYWLMLFDPGTCELLLKVLKETMQENES